jgi:hypothetical protein
VVREALTARADALHLALVFGLSRMPPGARSRAGGEYLGQHDGQEAAAGFREDTGDMDRGRAETHLRQLAEAELRSATEPGALGRGPAGRLPLVAQALIAVGAVDVGTADQIQAELGLALAARYQAADATWVNGPDTGQRSTAPHTTRLHVIDVTQVC